MTLSAAALESAIADAHAQLGQLQQSLSGVLIGQQALIEQLILTISAGGHVLIEGLPGLGKTQLAKALASCLDLPLARIQCTPDLMPGDITGTDVLVSDANAASTLAFKPGPIFASLVLVDEINRATPKAQAALLEAMQEHQVTHLGTRHTLPSPFWVMATQNPIEMEGTYPLPEAQLDRFMVKLEVGFPAEHELMALIDASLDGEPADRVGKVMSLDQLTAIQQLSQQILISDSIKQQAVKLIMATQPGATVAGNNNWTRCGASPRALQSLLRGARIRALQHGRAHVSLEDLASLAAPVLRHRILLNIEVELDGHDVESVIQRIVSEQL